jgi:hypothetical protein
MICTTVQLVKQDNNMAYTKEFNLFWDTYPKDLCGGARNKGTKQEAEKMYSKKIKSLEAHEDLMRKMREQIRQDKKVLNAGGKPYRWPYASSYMSKNRWQVEMDSTQEVLESIPKQFCRCGNQDARYALSGTVKNGKLVYSERICAVCWRANQKDHVIRLNEANKRIGLVYKGKYHENETAGEYKSRCREWFLKNGARTLVGKVIEQ